MDPGVDDGSTPSSKYVQLSLKETVSSLVSSLDSSSFSSDRLSSTGEFASSSFVSFESFSSLSSLMTSSFVTASLAFKSNEKVLNKIRKTNTKLTILFVFIFFLLKT